MELHFIATTTFGLEATAKREITRLGFSRVSGMDGRIDFYGGLADIPKANIWLRSPDRVLLVIGEFEALTFDELFEKTKALPWDEWIPEDGKFTVTGKSVKSALFSVSDCQAIVKKAVVEKLKTKYKTEWFAETGAEYKIQVGLLRDVATLTIDTTGPGLHKRGYRPEAIEAPIKETLAAAMIELSYWRKGRVLFDPFCGSGTIPIEAAMIAKNIAPGLKRHFASEKWEQIPSKMWKDAREEARSVITDTKAEIYGSDIDGKSIELARYNAKRAGVSDCIHFETKDVYDAQIPSEYGVMITNPPYGQRLGESGEVKKLYKRLGEMFQNDRKWSVYVITSDENFEKLYGRKADAKRKLFNGMIKTDYYQYFGEKPKPAE